MTMRRLRLASLAIWIAVAGSPAASAECPEDSWRSELPAWVAVVGDEDEDGIGGSGLAPADGGIGSSTPMPGDDDGIGGSGVLGTITGFGSICINGARIAYETDVPVTLLGEVHGSEVLAVGQVVAVDLEPGTNPASARAITVRYALVGPAEVLGEVLQVLGQSVEPMPGATLPVIERGQRVAVSGLRRPDGTIAASRIDVAGPELPDAVNGALRIDAEGTARVAGVEVVTAATGRVEAAPDAVAIGRWDPISRSLTEARVAVDPAFAGRVERVDIEGYVHTAADGRLRLGEPMSAGMDLVVPAPAVQSQETRALLEAGARVRVEATRNAKGDMQVQRVWILRERELMQAISHSADERLPRPSRELPGDRPRHRRMLERPMRDGLERPDRLERPELLDRPDRPEPPGDWGSRPHRPRR